MIQRVFFTVAFALAFVPRDCASVDWETVGGDFDRSVVVDYDSIVKAKSKSKAWTRQDFWRPRYLDDDLAKPYQSMLTLYHFDCDGQRMATGAITYYAGTRGSGKVVESISRPFKADQLIDVVPGTIGAIYLASACAGAEQLALLRAANKRNWGSR